MKRGVLNPRYLLLLVTKEHKLFIPVVPFQGKEFLKNLHQISQGLRSSVLRSDIFMYACLKYINEPLTVAP
jgi:hypothetical protein